MARAPAGHERLRAISSRLTTVGDGAAPVLPGILEDLRELLGADATCAYSVRVVNNACEPEYVYGAGSLTPHFTELTRRYLESAPIPWGTFDPSRPQAAQRNAVFVTSDLPIDPEKPLPAIARDLFPKVGLAQKDQLRVLVCEGESLLGWVGGYRTEPFTQREKGLLEALVEPLRQRLTLERRLETSAIQVGALKTTLEQLGAAAFILGPRGRVMEANSAGHALLAAVPELSRTLALAVRGEPTDFVLTRIAAPGMADHHLAVRRAMVPDAKAAAALAAKKWRLTPRQTDVLELLAEGLSNRAISARLGCSESTVEIHVSAVLSKADAESRAALVARVWTQR